jgi:uncharacterized protein (TIGR01777 family)
VRTLITGATGFLGRRLVASLLGDGEDVVVTSRNPARAAHQLGESVRAFGWDYRREPFPAAALEGVSVVCHLMGENIAAGRWTRRKKQELRGSRIESTQKLVAALPDSVTDFLCASAIGIYPGDSHEPFDEGSQLESPTSFMTQLCTDWEAAAAAAETPSRRRVSMRIGLVLGEAGMLAALVPLYRLGLGGPLADGRQQLPWVHVDDLVAMLRFVATHRELSGPVNLVGPAPISLGELSRSLAAVLKRPHFLRIPGRAVRAVLGEASAMVLSSYNVLPSKLLESGFEYRYRSHEPALQSVIRDYYQ